MVVDAVLSTITILITLWLSPEDVTIILGLIAVWQVPVYALITGIATEDAAEKGAWERYYIPEGVANVTGEEPVG